MKKLIKALVFLGVLALGLYVFAVPRIPEWTVSIVLGHMKNQGAQQLLQEEGAVMGENETILVQKFLDHLSYEVLGSSIEGDRAYVDVDFTLPDLNRLIEDNWQALSANLLQDIGGVLGALFGGSIQEAAMGHFVLLLEDPAIEIPLMPYLVTVPLERRHYIFWEPVITDEWIETTFGPLFNLDFDDFFR